MDINMPVCDGVEGTNLIKGLNKSIKVLILTTFYDEKIILPAFNNGADGYILKGIKPEEFISTVKSVAKGLKVINQNVFDTFLKHCTPEIKNNFQSNKIDNINLTEIEQKIIHYIVQGKTNGEIAANIYLSEGRVRNIITGILAKLGLGDRTMLAVYAVRNNLV
jgi:DNA-binding NarL/FixJ family response regulator